MPPQSTRPRWTRRWKQALQWLLPVLFTECPSGTAHWFFERWCLCEYQDCEHQGGARGRVFDLKRWERARQGPEGYRPGNTNVQLGDYVQPEGLGLRPPLAWKVVGFEAQGSNPKYRVVLEYPLSGERLTVENLPRNTRPPGEANDPGHLDGLSEVLGRRAAREKPQATRRRSSACGAGDAPFLTPFERRPVY